MAQQARSLNNLIFYLLVFLAGCNLHTNDKKVMINSTTGNFHNANGRIFLDNKPFTGYVYTLFASGDTAEISGYSNGKEDGMHVKFYDDGKIREKREFSNGQKTGSYLAWWENGREKLLYHFENDEYEGTCQEWNREGKLIKEMNYRKGHEEGLQKMFYDNGKVRANYIVENGRRYGLLGTKNCVNVSDSVFKN